MIEIARALVNRVTLVTDAGQMWTIARCWPGQKEQKPRLTNGQMSTMEADNFAPQHDPDDDRHSLLHFFHTFIFI